MRGRGSTAPLLGSHRSVVAVIVTRSMGIGEIQPNQPEKTRSDHSIRWSNSISATRSMGMRLRVQLPRCAVRKPSATV